jgi:hypothetical protein
MYSYTSVSGEHNLASVVLQNILPLSTIQVELNLARVHTTLSPTRTSYIKLYSRIYGRRTSSTFGRAACVLYQYDCLWDSRFQTALISSDSSFSTNRSKRTSCDNYLNHGLFHRIAISNKVLLMFTMKGGTYFRTSCCPVAIFFSISITYSFSPTIFSIGVGATNDSLIAAAVVFWCAFGTIYLFCSRSLR